MENYKTLMKEIEDDTNKCEAILCSWIRRQYCQDVNITQRDLQIQCNPYKNPYDIFSEVEKPILYGASKTKNRISV